MTECMECGKSIGIFSDSIDCEECENTYCVDCQSKLKKCKVCDKILCEDCSDIDSHSCKEEDSEEEEESDDEESDEYTDDIVFINKKEIALLLSNDDTSSEDWFKQILLLEKNGYIIDEDRMNKYKPISIRIFKKTQVN